MAKEEDVNATQEKEENEENAQCCHRNIDTEHRIKVRSEEEYKSLLNRLNRIEGQVRGVKRMVEESTYCTDILIQVSAINAALNSFSKELLTTHLHTCVAEDIRNGKDEVIDDLLIVLKKMMK